MVCCHYSNKQKSMSLAYGRAKCKNTLFEAKEKETASIPFIYDIKYGLVIAGLGVWVKIPASVNKP